MKGRAFRSTILIIILLIVVMAIPVIYHYTHNRFSERLAEYSRRNKKNEAVIVVPEGCAWNLGGGLKEAVVTGDRRHFIMIKDDNSLLLSGKNPQNIIFTDVNIKNLVGVTDDAVFYISDQGDLIFFDFDDSKNYIISERVRQAMNSRNGINVMYQTQDGDLRFYGRDGTNVLLMDGCDDVKFYGLSDNGKLKAWTEGSQGNIEYDMYFADGGNREYVGCFAPSDFGRVFFSKDENAAITKYGKYGMHLKYGDFSSNYYIKASQDNDRIKYVPRLLYGNPMTGICYFDKTDVKFGAPIYFPLERCIDVGTKFEQCTISTGEMALGYIKAGNEDYEYEVAEPIIKDFIPVSDGYLYLTEKNGLYRCRYNNTSRDLIDTDIVRFYGTQHGSYIFYIKELQSEKRDVLGIYDLRTGMVRTLKSLDHMNVMTSDEICIDTVGSNIYFICNMKDEKNPYKNRGDLYAYNLKEDRARFISTNVMAGSFDSGIESNDERLAAGYSEVYSNDFNYFVYKEENGTDIVYDVYHYDGLLSYCVVTDIIGNVRPNSVSIIVW